MKSMKVFTRKSRMRTLEADFGFIIGLALAIEKSSRKTRKYILVLPFVAFTLSIYKLQYYVF